MKGAVVIFSFQRRKCTQWLGSLTCVLCAEACQKCESVETWTCACSLKSVSVSHEEKIPSRTADTPRQTSELSEKSVPQKVYAWVSGAQTLLSFWCSSTTRGMKQCSLMSSPDRNVRVRGVGSFLCALANIHTTGV